MVKCFLRLTIVISLLLTGACGSDPASSLDNAAVFPAATANNYVPGEVLLRFRPEASATRATAANTENLLAGARIAERITIGGYRRGSAARAGITNVAVPAIEILRLQLPNGMSVEDGITQLTARSDVLYAEPNYRVHRAMVPNDHFFGKQWGLENTGQRITGDKGTITGTPGVDIGAAKAWDVSHGDGSVIVATIDSGIDYDHEDLATNIWLNPGETGSGKETNNIDDDGNGYVDDWHGWNFFANTNDPKDDDLDSNGHGSHLAGIIGAVGNNSFGVSGINWKIQLMPLKFFPASGGGNVANAVKAINYAVANGARIINASYEYIDDPSSQTEKDTIATAGIEGVLFVAAAGNNGAGTSGSNIDNRKVYPAAHALDNIIAVAATDPHDNKASFSNYGVTSVDLGAPGVNIYSTVRWDRTGLDQQRGFDYMSGTSMAAPMVSGAAALLWSQYPQLTALEVRERLFATVDRTSALSGRVATGGRLNLDRAMRNDVNPPLALLPPTDLTASADAAGIHLKWIDNSWIETGFKVERRDENALSFVEIVNLSTDSSSYTDGGVLPGGRYVYRVRAFNALENSAYSNEILAQMVDGGSGSGSSNCFIATAAYGTPFMPQVTTLRTFRDRVLLTNGPGRAFVALYYRTSPPLADFIAGHDTLRAAVRTLLRPLVWLARVLTPSEAQAMSQRPTPPAAVVEDADVVAGELLVCFRPELSAEAITTILRAEESERLEQIASQQGTLLRIKLAAGVTTIAAQKNFSAYKEIVYAEPNRRVRLRKP